MKKAIINFNSTAADMQLIRRIVIRAMALKIKYFTAMDCDMDVTACHCNGNPLRLADMLAADDFNFAHDVLGIRSHINRETGQLTDCFCPRFSAPLPVA
jgi:hypothetical protein